MRGATKRIADEILELLSSFKPHALKRIARDIRSGLQFQEMSQDEKEIFTRLCDLIADRNVVKSNESA